MLLVDVYVRVVVNHTGLIACNSYYWYVIVMIYVYFHNICTTILLFKPLGTRVRGYKKMSESVRELEKGIGHIRDKVIAIVSLRASMNL